MGPLTQVAEGLKNSFAPRLGVVFTLMRLVVLFCRENAGWPTGILPRAFSDIPRNWSGTVSSIEEAIDALREAPLDGDCFGEDGVGSVGRFSVSASESSSSSPPMANAAFSSGTSLRVGVRVTAGLRTLSMESDRIVSSPCSFLSWFWRSISS